MYNPHNMQGKETISIDKEDNFDSRESISPEVFNTKTLRTQEKNVFKLPQSNSVQLLDSESEDDEEALSTTKNYLSMQKKLQPQNLAHMNHQPLLPGAGPSEHHPIPKLYSPKFGKQHDQSSSDSDSGESETRKIKAPIPGEYNPYQYDDLEVNEDIKELFQYILKYTPQNLNLDFKFKPFIPDFIPAVGDIDAFLKVFSPDVYLSGEPHHENKSKLGLTVLDEPGSKQSDSALLYLQLKASSVSACHINMVVKKVDNVEKSSKTVEKWIKDIIDLHRTKSSPIVKYTDPMPDIDDLMQEWPEATENLLKVQGIPSFKLPGPLSDYTDIVFVIFDIPVYKNRIQSLHLLFNLFAAIKNSQLYKVASEETDKLSFAGNEKNVLSSPDQLVLD